MNRAVDPKNEVSCSKLLAGVPWMGYSSPGPQSVGAAPSPGTGPCGVGALWFSERVWALCAYVKHLELISWRSGGRVCVLPTPRVMLTVCAQYLPNVAGLVAHTEPARPGQKSRDGPVA